MILGEKINSPPAIFTSSSFYNKVTERRGLSLVIPTYNESENVPELIEKIEILQNNVSFEIIIVDDNSPDGTAEIAEVLNAKHGNIKVCKRPGKLGLSSAVLEGFRNSNADIVAVMDADMQHPPEVLLEMYKKMCEGNDLVVASRYVDGGGVSHWKTRRILYSKVATILAHLLVPNSRRIKDVMSGYFMVRKDRLGKSDLNPIGFKILLEILANRRFNKVAEVPYVFVNRRNGKSNLSGKEIQNYVIQLYRIFVRIPRSIFLI